MHSTCYVCLERFVNYGQIKYRMFQSYVHSEKIL